LVLGKVKQCVSDFTGDFGGELSCIITIPSYFNDVQRQATRDAGTIAGMGPSHSHFKILLFS
jgi:molecular chaperone DnaK (HSP70)